MPGIANSWVDSAAVLVISGQARTDQDTDGRVRQLGNKALNVVDLVKSITKYAVKIVDPSTIRYHLEKAVYIATHGRLGPVWIDLPIDIQGMVIDEEDLKRFNPDEMNSATGTPVDELRRKILHLVELLKQSSRPVILAGGGIRNAGAVELFLRLIDRLQIPCSPAGAAPIGADDHYFVGRPSAYGQRSANFVIQNCDLPIRRFTTVDSVGRNADAFAGQRARS